MFFFKNTGTELKTQVLFRPFFGLVDLKWFFGLAGDSGISPSTFMSRNVFPVTFIPSEVSIGMFHRNSITSTWNLLVLLMAEILRLPVEVGSLSHYL